VRDGQDGKHFSITSVKPHHTPVDIINHFMSDLLQVFLSTLLISFTRSPNFSTTPTELIADYRVGLTDMLTPKDPRRFDPRFRAAKGKEIKGLARRATCRVVCAEDLPDNAKSMDVGRSVAASSQMLVSVKEWYSKAIALATFLDESALPRFRDDDINGF
jgi:hypothetical protein